LSSALRKANSTSAASSSRTPPKRSRSRARSSPAGNGKAKDDGKLLPLDVKAGDRILFGKYAGQEIKLDGEEYLIMKEDEVLAVIEGETKKKLVVKGKIKKKK
jgi:co-chaperonin GroES (HSP10)